VQASNSSLTHFIKLIVNSSKSQMTRLFDFQIMCKFRPTLGGYDQWSSHLLAPKSGQSHPRGNRPKTKFWLRKILGFLKGGWGWHQRGVTNHFTPLRRLRAASDSSHSFDRSESSI
jgi:hypothetical protein